MHSKEEVLLNLCQNLNKRLVDRNIDKQFWREKSTQYTLAHDAVPRKDTAHKESSLGTTLKKPIDWEGRCTNYFFTRT